MSPPSPTLPNPNALSRTLRDLFGKAVGVKAGTALAASVKPFVAVYEDDDKEASCVCLCEVALAAAFGAALALMPAGLAAEAVKTGKLPPEMLENAGEVLNIMASLFGAKHVRYRGLFQPGAAAPPPVVALIGKPGARLDLEVAVTGYPGGRLALLVR
jgi:hypothetical protein